MYEKFVRIGDDLLELLQNFFFCLVLGEPAQFLEEEDVMGDGSVQLFLAVLLLYPATRVRNAGTHGCRPDQGV